VVTVSVNRETVKVAYYILNFSDIFAQSVFQKSYRNRRYQKRYILKSIDVTDNGTKKYRVTNVPRYCPPMPTLTPLYLRWLRFNALNESSWHWIYQFFFSWSNTRYFPLG